MDVFAVALCALSAATIALPRVSAIRDSFDADAVLTASRSEEMDTTTRQVGLPSVVVHPPDEDLCPRPMTFSAAWLYPEGPEAYNVLVSSDATFDKLFFSSGMAVEIWPTYPILESKWVQGNITNTGEDDDGWGILFQVEYEGSGSTRQMERKPMTATLVPGVEEHVKRRYALYDEVYVWSHRTNTYFEGRVWSVDGDIVKVYYPKPDGVGGWAKWLTLKSGDCVPRTFMIKEFEKQNPMGLDFDHRMTQRKQRHHQAGPVDSSAQVKASIAKWIAQMSSGAKESLRKRLQRRHAVSAVGSK